MQDTLEKRIELSAPLARVWRALTDSHQFGEWFRVKMDGPFLPGEAIAGQLTWPGYEHLKMEIVVQKMEPMSFFSYTWHPYAVNPKVDYSQETPTLVEFRLEQVGNVTVVVVTESGFAKLPKERYADAFRMNTQGWQQQLENIRAYVGKTS